MFIVWILQMHLSFYNMLRNLTWVCDTRFLLLCYKDNDFLILIGHIYFSDWKLEAIIRINKQGNQQVTLRKGIEFLRDITIYDKDIQQKPGMIYIIFIQQTKTLKNM